MTQSIASIPTTNPPFPLNSTFNRDHALWYMSPGEQTTLIYFLQNLKPKVAIEVGTQFGGSLQVLSHFSSKVYSLDIDPEVPRRLEGKYSNVEYIIGDSSETLPPLVEKLQKENAEVSFILIDGGHDTETVKKDIEALLKLQPVVPLYILLHDSFYPPCRMGMCLADWKGCSYAHNLELDYVVGGIPVFGGIITGGFALANLLPYPRQKEFEVTAWGQHTFHQMLQPLIEASK